MSEKTDHEIAQLAEEHGKIVAKWIHDFGLTGVVEFLALEALAAGMDPAKVAETLEKARIEL